MRLAERQQGNLRRTGCVGANDGKLAVVSSGTPSVDGVTWWAYVRKHSGGAPNAPAEVAAQAASDTIVRTGDLTPPLALLAALAAATFALFVLAARNARRP